MLSRVANSLYWMARYVERAEDMSRVLAINFHTQLDARQVDSERAWKPLVSMTGDCPLFERHYDGYTAANVVDFILWNPNNPSAVASCVTFARENARSVREQITREMWEYLNRLYFATKEANREAVSREPHEFFASVRDGSHAFQGIADQTMTHGEAYRFIELGKYLERADKTARALDIYYPAVRESEAGMADDPLSLMALLKACSAFEPFRRAHASQMRAASAVEYLLADKEFPRAVAYCLRRSLNAVSEISGGDGGMRRIHGLASPQRSLGRLVSELEYLDVREVLGVRLHEYLGELVTRINGAGDDVASTFFSTQVIMPELHPQQAQQQQ